MKKLILWTWLAATGLSAAGTSGLSFVYQPLTPLGTDGDPDPVITRIPIIANSVAEDSIAFISAKNKLLQRKEAFAEDSNLLSCLGISVWAKHVSEEEGYEVYLDLSKMAAAGEFGQYAVTPRKVVELGVKCIRDTLPEVYAGSQPWHIRVIPQKPGDEQWKPFESIYKATK